MKRYGKLLSILLAVLMFAGLLAACGGSPATTAAPTTKATEAKKTEAEKTEAEKTEAEKTEAEKTEAEETEPPQPRRPKPMRLRLKPMMMDRPRRISRAMTRISCRVRKPSTTTAGSGVL